MLIDKVISHLGWKGLQILYCMLTIDIVLGMRVIMAIVPPFLITVFWKAEKGDKTSQVVITRKPDDLAFRCHSRENGNLESKEYLDF